MPAQTLPPFDRYRDRFVRDIRNGELRQRVLEELLDRYDSYQVAAATQIADWVDTTTNNLNASGVWTAFARYGLVGDVQKIYTARSSNKLFVVPMLDWLDQWDGSPAIQPTSRKVSHLRGVQATLVDHRAEEVRGTEQYVRRRLGDDSPPDPKAAFVYGKLHALDVVTVEDPDVSVSLETLNSDETERNHPPSYDAIRIDITVEGESVEVSDRETLERTLRTLSRTLAHASCYHFRTAESSGAEESQPENDGQEPIPEEVPVPSRDEQDGYGPYVVSRREFVQGFEFDGIEVSSNSVSCRAQLGPTWTSREVDG